MAGSLNKVMLIGNLGADPEIRHTQDGRPIANLRMATTESWRDRNTGERREKTEWHRVVIFSEGLCKIVEQYLKKGSRIYIEGQLQTRKWQDQSGQDRYSTEVVLQGFGGTLTMLDGRGGGDMGGGEILAAAAAITVAANTPAAPVAAPNSMTKFRSRAWMQHPRSPGDLSSPPGIARVGRNFGSGRNGKGGTGMNRPWPHKLRRSAVQPDFVAVSASASG